MEIDIDTQNNEFAVVLKPNAADLVSKPVSDIY